MNSAINNPAQSRQTIDIRKNGLEVLLENGTARLQVRSSSMLPVIAPGDRVDVSPCQLENLVIGDIVVVHNSGILVVHRFLMGGRMIVTKGDNHRRADLPVDRRKLIGRVICRERDGAVTRLDGYGARARGIYSLIECTLARFKDMLGM